METKRTGVTVAREDLRGCGFAHCGVSGWDPVRDETLQGGSGSVDYPLEGRVAGGGALQIAASDSLENKGQSAKSASTRDARLDQRPEPVVSVRVGIGRMLSQAQ